MPKISSKDRILQRTVEQVLDVPVPPMIEEVVEVQDRVSEQDPSGTVCIWPKFIPWPSKQAEEHHDEACRKFLQEQQQSKQEEQ